MNYSHYISRIKNEMINVDISYKCQLRCPLCDRNTKDQKSMIERIKQSEDISIDDFKKIVNFFPQINLCGTISDPIYHSNFLSLLDYFNKSGFYRINTNGTGKSLDWYELAFNKTKLNTVWVFSLDGLVDTSGIYRINQNTEHVWQVMKLGVKLNVKIIWKYIVFKYNEHQIEEAKKLAKENKFVLELVKSTLWNNKLSREFKPSDIWTSPDSEGSRRIWIA